MNECVLVQSRILEHKLQPNPLYQSIRSIQRQQRQSRYLKDDDCPPSPKALPLPPAEEENSESQVNVHAFTRIPPKPPRDRRPRSTPILPRHHSLSTATELPSHVYHEITLTPDGAAEPYMCMLGIRRMSSPNINRTNSLSRPTANKFPDRSYYNILSPKNGSIRTISQSSDEAYVDIVENNIYDLGSN